MGQISASNINPVFRNMVCSLLSIEEVVLGIVLFFRWFEDFAETWLQIVFIGGDNALNSLL